MLLNNSKKKPLLAAAIKVIVALVAFLFVSYRIVDQIKSGQLFTLVDILPVYFLAAFVLVFVNWIIESVKWYWLTSGFQPLTISQSLKSVLTGLSISLFTPNRVGEFAGRILILHPHNRMKGILATVVSSISQMLAIFVFGYISFLLTTDFPKELNWIHSYKTLISITGLMLVIILLALYFAIPYLSNRVQIKRWPRITRFFKTGIHLQPIILLRVFIYSLLRYGVFACQFYLLLRFTGLSLPVFPSLYAISLMYVCITLVPSFALAELGIRGAIAVFFISAITPFPTQILAATIIIWILNIALPALVGSWILYQSRIEL